MLFSYFEQNTTFNGKINKNIPTGKKIPIRYFTIIKFNFASQLCMPRLPTHVCYIMTSLCFGKKKKKKN